MLDPGQWGETRVLRDRTVTVQWAVLHVIEHYALHLAHMQLTRQLFQAQTKDTQ